MISFPWSCKLGDKKQFNGQVIGIIQTDPQCLTMIIKIISRIILKHNIIIQPKDIYGGFFYIKKGDDYNGN